MVKQTSGKGGKGAGKKAATKPAAKPATKTPAASGAKPSKQYALGAQGDGSVVLRVGTDFDLMVLRKAVEKQQKNAGAAVGTVSALADGEDPFIDAVQRSCERLLKTINASRSPANQIKGTPIGDEIAAAESEGASTDADTHSGGARKWAPAIPAPRPIAGDVVQHPDGKVSTIVDALGFRGDGLRGDEDEAELQKLADDGKLTGAFMIVPADGPNVLVKHHDKNVWRTAEGDYSSTPAANNIASTVANVADKATGKDAKKK
jgi:hypothetical protein